MPFLRKSTSPDQSQPPTDAATYEQPPQQDAKPYTGSTPRDFAPLCQGAAKPDADEAAATMVESLRRNERHTAANMVERQAAEIAALHRLEEMARLAMEHARADRDRLAARVAELETKLSAAVESRQRYQNALTTQEATRDSQMAIELVDETARADRLARELEAVAIAVGGNKDDDIETTINHIQGVARAAVQTESERDKALAELATERAGHLGTETRAVAYQEMCDELRARLASATERAIQAKAESDARERTLVAMTGIFFRSGLVDDRRLVEEAKRVKESEAQWKERAKRLQAFKDLVHHRLDAMGVPAHPDGKHSEEGCRIGDRLDIVAQWKDGQKA